MNTHNIGFYEDLTKIIFKLSSNIIKYAPHIFFWLLLVLNDIHGSVKAFSLLPKCEPMALIW